jgi:hypothetical protein
LITVGLTVPVNDLYFPATHGAHGPPSGPADPALQVQLVKAALPAGELEFDGQALHVELAAAPTAVEYVLAPQSRQVTVPVNDLYFPATHSAQGPPFGPVDPVLQVQLVKDALPSGELEFGGQALHFEMAVAPTAAEYVPAPQGVQVTVPVNALYFPAVHGAHGPPFGPVDPVLQVQLVKAELPTGEMEFDGQGLHLEIADAPTAVEYVPAPQPMQAALPAGEYVPAPQFVQVAVPVNALYFPATHGSHGPPFGPVDPVLQ